MKILCIILMMFCLAGCAKPTYETIADVPVVAQIPAKQQMILNLPSEAAEPVMSDETAGKVYECDGYTLWVQTMDSGDLNKTIQTLTGLSPDCLEILSSERNGVRRYDCVFATTGEDGLQVGRVCVLDDGNYHYAVSAFAPENTAGQVRGEWQNIFGSFQLTDADWDISTGS